MKAFKVSGLLLLLALSFLFTGCFNVNSEFRNVRNHLLTGIKSGYEKDQEFALGSISMSLLNQVIKATDNDSDNKELIENISEIQIGIYKKKDAGENPDFGQFTKICRVMESGGWLRMVRNFENNEISAVFLKLNTHEHLTRMFVISMNHEELVLTDIQGKLDRVFQIALKDKGLHVGSINN